MTQRRLRNAGVAAAAIVILAGLGGLTAHLVGGRAARHSGTRAASEPTPNTRPASDAPAGSVLSLTPQGGLVVSDLRGHRPKLLTTLPQQVYVTATLDNRYFLASNGQLLSIGAADHLSATRLAGVSQDKWSPVSGEPLADHDHYVALEYYNSNNSPADGFPISVRSLATGTAQLLGTADTIAADPAAIGVIASEPAQPTATSSPVSASQNGEWPDGAVVLRDLGRKDVLLGTAARLNADVHLPASTPTYLFAVPDPAGDKIAIVVQPQVSGRAAGVVVLSRTGHELYAASNMGKFVSASWSASGRSLAMPAQLPHGSALHIWTAGRSTSVQQFPGHADYGSCTWSPDGAWILCAVGGPHATGEQWVVASAAGHPMIVTTGPGFPVTWLGRSTG